MLKIKKKYNVIKENNKIKKINKILYSFLVKFSFIVKFLRKLIMNFFKMGLNFVIVNPVFFKGFILFRFELRRLISGNKSYLVEKLGFFNADKSFRFVSLNTFNLGVFLNNGSFIKKPKKFVKYIISFLLK